MQQTITLRGREVSYTIRRNRRARRMLLSVYADGRVVVTTPYRASARSAETLLKSKAPWLFKHLAYFEKRASDNPLHDYSREAYLRHREAARELVLARLEELNRIYGFRYNRVAIRNQRTCWGSCSAKGNLNFSYKILFLPQHLQDYVIAHELCHLKEMNHSARFWALVARSVPGYAQARRELRASSLLQ